MSKSLSDEAVQQITEAVFAGKKILAIKLYRGATGVGLKDAKDFIEALEVRLRQESPEKFTAPPGAAGCSRTAAALAIIATGFYLALKMLLA